ncbi:hypothetical protein E2B89_04735 [Salmonella enterica]|nr:hypothetical protein [Salmonella enterica]EAV3184838.1 hypothetical protein [Salmonella enterica subsp. enterica]EBH9875826.1 hypothetical protein [Salmonella enterica subsp. enterica serovar 6,7:-1,5]EAM6716029.1 hypothetical protein [Salmonella enterica]EAO0948645.1 hypothetical protein [Salmonella enterica]
MGCSTHPGQRINRSEGERSAVSDIDGKRAGSVAAVFMPGGGFALPGLHSPRRPDKRNAWRRLYRR